MSTLTATITSAQKFELTATPEDASGAPAPAPGPLVWTDPDTTLGTFTPAADGLSGLFTPVQPPVAGVAHITAGIPSVPDFPSVEADITVTIPLADHLVLTGQVVP